jgi:hypothetical protein
LVDFLLKGVDKNPDRRFQSAEKYIEAMEEMKLRLPQIRPQKKA